MVPAAYDFLDFTLFSWSITVTTTLMFISVLSSSL